MPNPTPYNAKEEFEKILWASDLSAKESAYVLEKIMEVVSLVEQKAREEGYDDGFSTGKATAIAEEYNK